MPISQEQTGSIIDVRPLGTALASTKTSALVKSERLEVIRLVLPRGKEIPAHQTFGEITLQCLEGRIAFTTESGTRELGAGQILHLPGEQVHTVLGIDDASLLLTIVLPGAFPAVADSTRRRWDELSTTNALRRLA